MMATKKGKASPHPVNDGFRQKTCYSVKFVLLTYEKFNRIAKCGTTNESASADFFVSPKTKNCRTGYTRAAENSEIRLLTLDIHTHFDTIRV
jgi:hypothetical protein